MAGSDSDKSAVDESTEEEVRYSNSAFAGTKAQILTHLVVQKYKY
jgi:hypothetical protein